MFLGPYFPTPFTDFLAIITPNYRLGIRSDLCAKIEMRFHNCLEAYGSEKAKEKCMELFYDVFECYNKNVQILRVNEIRAQRKKMYKSGEISELYSEKPPLESYFHI